MQPEAKIKEPINTAEPAPVEQWDQVAFKLILQELAPKGFSEIKRGPWRGKVQSNIPFLPKQSVNNCQKIAAQMVRTFRVKIERAMKEQLKNVDDWAEKDRVTLGGCRFWQFKKKAELKGNIRSLSGQGGSLMWAIQQLKETGIK